MNSNATATVGESWLQQRALQKDALLSLQYFRKGLHLPYLKALDSNIILMLSSASFLLYQGYLSQEIWQVLTLGESKNWYFFEPILHIT